MKKENKALWQQPSQVINLCPWQEYTDTPTDIKEQEDHAYLIFRNDKVLRIPAKYIDAVKDIKGKKLDGICDKLIKQGKMYSGSC